MHNSFPGVLGYFLRAGCTVVSRWREMRENE